MGEEECQHCGMMSACRTGIEEGGAFIVGKIVEYQCANCLERFTLSEPATPHHFFRDRHLANAGARPIGFAPPKVVRKKTPRSPKLRFCSLRQSNTTEYSLTEVNITFPKKKKRQ